MLEKTDILMSNSISFNFNYQVRTHTPSTKREASENTFGFWQVKSSYQMLSYNFCNSNTSHRCSAILLPRNISTTKALSVDKPTKSQLSHWNSQRSSTRETLLLVSIETDYQLGCSRFRMLDVSFSGFDQQAKPGHQLLAFGYFNPYFFWYFNSYFFWC